MIKDIRAIAFNTDIILKFMAIVIYVVLGYLACAFIVKKFEFANGIPRMIVFSLLLGWAAIPIALLLLVLRACAKFFVWLFDLKRW